MEADDGEPAGGGAEALRVFEFWAVETETLERPNPVQPWRHAPKRGQRLPRDVSDEVVEQLWTVIRYASRVINSGLL